MGKRYVEVVTNKDLNKIEALNDFVFAMIQKTLVKIF